MWLTGTASLPSPTPPSSIYCSGSCLVYAGIIELEYITHRMPKLTILQLVFIGPESEGEKSVPVLQCGDWLMQVKTCSVELARSQVAVPEWAGDVPGRVGGAAQHRLQGAEAGQPGWQVRDRKLRSFEFDSHGSMCRCECQVRSTIHSLFKFLPPDLGSLKKRPFYSRQWCWEFTRDWESRWSDLNNLNLFAVENP